MRKRDIGMQVIRSGLEYEARVVTSLRKAFPKSAVYRNPNIVSQKGFDAFMVKGGKHISVEVKDSSKDSWYTKSRVSSREREWMDRIDAQGGISVLITRLKEAGRYVMQMVLWRDVQEEKIISPSVLRKKGAEKFERVRGEKEYHLRDALNRLVAKVSRMKGSVGSSMVRVKERSTGTRKYHEVPEFDSIYEINPKDRPGDFYFMKSMKWKRIIRLGWNVNVDMDGLSEKVAIEYKRWANPYDEKKYGTREVWRNLTAAWGRKLANDLNRKSIRGEVRKVAYGGLYNEKGVQYRIQRHESPKHFHTVIMAMQALKEHDRYVISGQPVDGARRTGSRPDIITIGNKDGKRLKIAIEVKSGDKSRNQYMKTFGGEYDKVILLDPVDPPKTQADYNRAKNKIWQKILQEVGA